MPDTKIGIWSSVSWRSCSPTTARADSLALVFHGSCSGIHALRHAYRTTCRQSSADKGFTLNSERFPDTIPDFVENRLHKIFCRAAQPHHGSLAGNFFLCHRHCFAVHEPGKESAGSFAPFFANLVSFCSQPCFHILGAYGVNSKYATIYKIHFANLYNFTYVPSCFCVQLKTLAISLLCRFLCLLLALAAF